MYETVKLAGRGFPWRGARELKTFLKPSPTNRLKVQKAIKEGAGKALKKKGNVRNTKIS